MGGHLSSLLPQRHRPCPPSRDVGVGQSDETEAEGQNWAATVLKYCLRPSAEPPIMSLLHSKPLCKTHLGPLNDFYTPGSFPDSHFIQLKSHSLPPLPSFKHLRRHLVAKASSRLSKFSHSSSFPRPGFLTPKSPPGDGAALADAPSPAYNRAYNSEKNLRIFFFSLSVKRTIVGLTGLHWSWRSQ